MFCDHNKQVIIIQIPQNTRVKNSTCLNIYSLNKEKKRENIKDFLSQYHFLGHSYILQEIYQVITKIEW